jgi:hypothetical protein
MNEKFGATSHVHQVQTVQTVKGTRLPASADRLVPFHRTIISVTLSCGFKNGIRRRGLGYPAGNLRGSFQSNQSNQSNLWRQAGPILYLRPAW